MKAVVLGGTGAVGEHLVGQLLAGPAWSNVVTIGRREVQVPKEYQGSKLQQRVVDMDKLDSAGSAAFHGADAVFCALGTTRKVAGSAEQFKKVDLEYVQKAAQAAKAAGVHHFSLCSAQGANASVWACDLAPLHGLLYKRTKGQAEEAVKGQGIPAVSIFRPGLLGRGQKARGIEKVAARFLTSTPAQQVAKAMIQDAEAAVKASRTGVKVLEEQDIMHMAAA